MATASLRLETEWEETRSPRLVLEDCSEAPSVKASHPRVRRVVSRRWENRLFMAASVAVLLFFLMNFALSLYHAAALSYQSPLAAPVVLPVRVHAGDTLWTYAQKYGSPNIYILDRVEIIARANHLASDSALVAGQRLLVPVSNPVLLAQIEHAHRLASTRGVR